MANPTTEGTQPELKPLQIEANGINVITDAERKGHPRDLFWPWFAANVSVLGLGYGAFVLDFGVSFWQAVALGLIGIIVSFLLCGFIAVAGKRGSAPTMVLGRAAYGVRGNKLPSLISWLLTVGWETVLIILATLATATVFERLGWGGGTAVKVIALIVVSALTVVGGVMGFDLIMRMQSVITWVTGMLTVVFIALVADKIHWHTVSAIPAGLAAEVHRRAGVRDDRVRARLGERGRRLLPLPAAALLGPGRDRLDHVRLVHRPDLPAGLRPAAGRLVGQAEQRDRRRPGRRADHPAAHLVPGPVRDRGRARPGGRLGAGHLLLRAVRC